MSYILTIILIISNNNLNMPHDICCVLGSKEPTYRKTKGHLHSSTAVKEYCAFKLKQVVMSAIRSQVANQCLG